MRREATGTGAVLDCRARLEIVAGPLQGQELILSSEPLSIGREPSNQLAILDSLLSRRHCLISKRGEEFWVQDLESRNGTFVNGLQVPEKALEHGDKITIGNSLFVFSLGRGTSDSAGSPPADIAEPAGSTIVLRREDALYLKSPLALASIPAIGRGVRELNALSNFSTAVHSVRNVEQLQRKALESILEVAPADRAAMLLTDETGECSSVLGWDRKLGFDQPVRVSQTVVRRVLDEGATVLFNDGSAAEEFREAQSLITPRVHAVLAVPLLVFDGILGLIYLDASDPSAQFDRDLMQLLTALGSIAALAIQNARHVEWLEGERQRLEEELKIEHSMIGESAAMRDVFQFISRVAPRDSTVLITGESGTGKELVARAIHHNSKRQAKSFIAINCAAIADTLLESELFGHEKGAFTGAVSQKKGKLELAEGGTVFLDEIGELAPLLQAKLLRVVQEREFERVGGTRTIKLDIRLVAATNRDLRAAAKAGTFREDLFYRLNVVSLKMPPLRERREDIPLLASYFASKYGERLSRRIVGIAPKTRACLMRYDWPGNVRELENAIERAVVLGSGEVLLPEDLPDSVIEVAAPGEEPATALHDALREAKKQIILRAVDQAGGNYTEAARALGVHPNHLFRLARTLELKQKRSRS